MRRIVLPATPMRLSGATRLAKLLVSQVCAGFPSPAKDLNAQRIDLAPVLAAHPQATWLTARPGFLMTEVGTLGNDSLAMNRAIHPRHRPIVVVVADVATSPSSACTR